MPGRSLVAALLLTVAAAASAESINSRMTIVEAIEAVRNGGVEIVYSSELIREWMLVREEPVSSEPIAALRQALQEYDLDLDEGPGGKWLVVRSTKPRPATSQPGIVVASAESAAPVRPVIEEITIVGSRHALFDRRGVTDQFLTGEEIREMPHIADDSFRALHRLPGVASNDFQAPFNLRGGTTSEVNVRIDGLEIIEPYHMRTLFQPLSIIDPGIIDEAQVLSGGFTAEHGNYASGVIDIATRRPDNRPEHEVGVSFVSAFARSGGEFGNGRGSYFLSGRRGYLDLLADEVVEPGEELKPRYADFYGRVSYLVTDSTDLSFQVLLAEDDVSFIDPEDGGDFQEDAAMQYGWITVDYEPRAGIHSSTKIFGGHIESTEDGDQFQWPTEDISRYFALETTQAGIQTDWVFAPNDKHMFKLGARYRELESNYEYFLNSVRRSDFLNNSAPFAVSRNVMTTEDGEDINAYAAWRTRMSPRWYLEAGLRWDSQGWTDVGNDSQVSPRLNGLFDVSDRTDLRFAWGKFYQPHAIQDLLVADGETRFHEPVEVDHTTLGVRHDFKSGLNLQADLYYKDYATVLPRYESLLDIYEFAPEANFDRALIAPESADAYGAEFTLRSSGDNSLDWWISYTWSKAIDKINGESIYRSWDQRHSAIASITWHGEKWTLSAVGRYHSGWPRTPLYVSPLLDPDGNVIGIDADLSQWNSTRFDSYSRVDVRASRKVSLSRGSFEYYFEVFNLFNAQNTCCTSNHRLTISPSPSVSPVFEEYLPMFPSFGFVWKFGPGAGS
jgi:hypothetical protein